MADPSYEDSQRLVLDAAAEETTSAWEIHSIVWAGSAARDIATGDGCLLQDTANNDIWSAEAITDLVGGAQISGLKLKVLGITAAELDGGVVYIYGRKLP